MEEFYLNPKKLHGVLKAKKINSLFHANTVLTSLTFIEKRALLSRAYVESNGLFQTPQKSDDLDKEFNVWDDFFFDGLDLHQRYRRANHYGPVLFVFDLDLLLAPSLPFLLVTRKNPLYWKVGEPLSERYCSSTDYIDEYYMSGKVLDASIMFTLRSPGTFLKLNKYLKEIIVDRPSILITLKIGGQMNAGKFVHDEIRKALDSNGLAHLPVNFRGFHACACNWNYTYMYANNFEEFRKRFKATND